jgi:hypothetical protein
MTDWTEIKDLAHHIATLANCDTRELELLADHEICGAETELSSRLAQQELLRIKEEDRQARANKAAGMFM